MTFTKFAFDVSLTFLMVLFLVVGVAFASSPGIALLIEVLRLIGIPMLALALCVVACGTWLKLTKEEWFGYFRAELLFLGVPMVVLFGTAAVFNILQGAPLDHLRNNVTVCGFGGVMLLTCWLFRRWNASCMPQIKALFNVR